ncbi:MAG: hypothetical protein LBC17_04235 [Lactobacillaceae bacterium]|jgi:hypothetical protein|nr:hypothetical protein [Lactobacillaceae bacterium]
MSYRSVAIAIGKLRNIEVTKDTVFKAVKLVTKLYDEQEDHRYFKDTELIEKIKVPTIYIEGDGIQVKTPQDQDKRTDMAHFVIHEGQKRVVRNRFMLENKFEIIVQDNHTARGKLLDYLYDYYDISAQTKIISNSDMGHGYTPYVFKEVAKVFKARHEHFWDSYHLNQRINDEYKNVSVELRERLYRVIKRYNKAETAAVLDTTESLLTDESELEKFIKFKKKLLANFYYTKPAYSRVITHHGIGIMESENSKIAFRMKYRGMYRSTRDAVTMAKMIINTKPDNLQELFFGE